MEIKNMSMEELVAMKEAINNEIKSRDNARRDELIQIICDAMNELLEVAPSTELNVSLECDDCCREYNIDVLYELCHGRDMNPKDFSVYY